MAKIKVIIKRPDEEFGHVRNINASLEDVTLAAVYMAKIKARRKRKSKEEEE